MVFKSSMKQKGVAGSGWPDTTSGGGRAHRMSMAELQPSNMQNDERRGILFLILLVSASIVTRFACSLSSVNPASLLLMLCSTDQLVHLLY